jgi:hypothetical protein
MTSLKEAIADWAKGKSDDEKEQARKDVNEVLAPTPTAADQQQPAQPSASRMTDVEYRDHVLKTYGYIPQT